MDTLWGAVRRVAVITDIHANLPALQASLEAIEGMGVEAIWCGGDLVGYGPHPNEVCRLIEERAIPTIYGNYDYAIGRDLEDCGCAYVTQHDRDLQLSVDWTLAHTDQHCKDFMRERPFDLRFELGSQRVRLVHGSPRKVNEYLFEDKPARTFERIAALSDCDVLAFGHTHKPWIHEYGGVLFVNCGSVGKPKDGDPLAAFAILEADQTGTVEARIERVPYDAQAVAREVAAVGLPGGVRREASHRRVRESEEREMKVVLFLCNHNAGRSQMAQAFFERDGPDDVRAESAGSNPARAIWPGVLEAMREVDIDLSGRKPRKLLVEIQLHADWAVTMGCGDACPYVPTTVEAWEIPDPAGLPVEQVRPIRDLIELKVRELIEGKLDAIRTGRTAHQTRLARLLSGLADEFKDKRSDWEIRACADAVLTQYDDVPIRSHVMTLTHRKTRECLRAEHCHELAAAN